MHSNLTLAMIAKMVIITFGNFDRYSDYKINRGKFEYSILAQGNNLKMLNNRIPSRTSLISTKTGKLDKPLQHLFIIPPFVFVFRWLSQRADKACFMLAISPLDMRLQFSECGIFVSSKKLQLAIAVAILARYQFVCKYDQIQMTNV